MKIIDAPYPPPTGEFTKRAASDIHDLVFHHSAGPKSQTPVEIDAFERTRGDVYLPYTYLIDDAGNVYNGRPPLAVSAATFGRNQQSIAVCVIGNFERNDAGYNGPPSQAALASMFDLALYTHRAFPSIVRTYTHGDVAAMFYAGDSDYATACCGDELREHVREIKSRVAAILRKH